MPTSNNDFAATLTTNERRYRYYIQAIFLIIILLVSLINLSLDNGPKDLWVATISTILGLISPAPKITKRKEILDTDYIDGRIAAHSLPTTVTTTSRKPSKTNTI